MSCDFATLSKHQDGEPFFCDLQHDESLFMGSGDIQVREWLLIVHHVQFDVYRSMRKANGNDWRAFVPKACCSLSSFLDASRLMSCG